MSVSTMRWPRFVVTSFLVTGIPFGLVIGLTSQRPMTGVFAGAFFGAVMTAIMGVSHCIAARSGRNLVDVHQSEQFLVKGTRDASEAAASAALRRLGIAHPEVERDAEVLVLEGRTGMTWKSWGEIVRVELGPYVGDATPIHVTSRPSLRTTLVDYGKNLANVRSVRAAIEA